MLTVYLSVKAVWLGNCTSNNMLSPTYLRAIVLVASVVDATTEPSSLVTVTRGRGVRWIVPPRGVTVNVFRCAPAHAAIGESIVVVQLSERVANWEIIDCVTNPKMLQRSPLSNRRECRLVSFYFILEQNPTKSGHAI